MYMANIFQKAGRFDLAATAIDYFLGHPFNGRVQVEADNPGQILWLMGEHWKFTRDAKWLARVYPSAKKIADMIRYYRTTPGPHYVWYTGLDYGESLPPDKRRELKPGACDGFNPAYTEAYDIAGLNGAITLAEALGKTEDAEVWQKLGASFLQSYEDKFGTNLTKGYGSYSVLWPCRLYPFSEGKACEQFKNLGPQQPTDWRYFPLARAHQGLLAGNRAAGCETINIHLEHEQMRGWYAFDEGGDSGVGGWNHVRTTWRQGQASDAMPHGWAIAEFQLLMRDCLLFEDGNKLVLFGGVPIEWFRNSDGMSWQNLPTHFGKCSAAYNVKGTNATLTLESVVPPPGGFVLRLPATLEAQVEVNGLKLSRTSNGDFLLPPKARRVEITYGSK